MKNFIFLLFVALLVPVLASAQDFSIKQNDFKTLFNQARFGQPEIGPWPGTYWPYSSHGTAANVVNGQFSRSQTPGENPMFIFDKIAGQQGEQSAYGWEMKSHTCDKLKGEDKESCESWWGHCNGWSAAAIKEDEPKQTFQVGGETLTTATAKGIFSEVWLSSGSLFSGTTDKGSKTSDGLKAGGWIDKTGDPRYQSFWDVSPRTFFLISTNYMGLAKMGFVIDRFTGNEVWNQPVVGYRVLPIQPSTIRIEIRGAQQVWAVPMKMKIYWGNDLNTPPGVVSPGFDIAKNSDDTDHLERLPSTVRGEQVYDSRILEFTLFFDAEVKVSPDGTQVLAAGKLVGDGVWKMQENPRQYSADDLDQSHPDFVWMPTNWVLDTTNDYGNPYLKTSAVNAIMAANKSSNGQGGAAPPPVSNPGGNGNGGSESGAKFKIAFGDGAFSNLARIDAKSVQSKLRRLFARANMRVSLYADWVVISGNSVSVTVDVMSGATKEQLVALFADAAVALNSIDSAN